MNLSVIIVNFNTYQLTKNTIDSVVESLNSSEPITFEIILVDNASSNTVQTQLKKKYLHSETVKLIINSSNLGFSKANNIGISNSTGEYILLLNSDTIVQEDCINTCLNYIKDHKDIGALGCKLLLENKTLDHACKRGFPTPEASLYYFLRLHKLFPGNKNFSKYTLGHQDINAINEVDSLTGAFMLLPRKIIDIVGLLDEDFFMYGEDLDWCFRIKEAGFKIIYYPKATTIHLKGRSSKKKRTKTIYEFHRAMVLFYRKHYKSKYPFFITWILYLSIFLRMIVIYFLNLFKK